jgi:hypothetical protein
LNRIDDVTIERVTLTREQLDDSLFEYEKHRNLHKFESKSSASTGGGGGNKKLNEEKFQLKMSTTIDRLEQDLNQFKYVPEMAQKSHIIVLPPKQNNRPQLSITDIVKNRKLITQKLESILNVDSSKLKITQDEASERSPIQNLNDLYKWTEVTTPKEENAEAKHGLFPSQQPTVALDECDEQDSSYQLFNSLYSQYFAHYYKYYLNKT